MLRIVLSGIFFLLFFVSVNCQTWEEAHQSKSGQLDLYWFTSVPFIFRDASGNLTGLEYEILEEFAVYIRQKHQVDLKLNWIEAPSFYSILEVTRQNKKPNTAGVSAFSITEERKTFAKFTDSFMPDVTVLVSSKGTPIVNTYDEINKLTKDMVAVTIKGTNYETLLMDIKAKLKTDFEIMYIQSDENVLQTISRASNRFGFIDLPIYLMLIRGGGELTRQNFFTFRGTGYGFLLPLSSDWDVPFREFLADSRSRVKVDEIISRHVGPELYQFIESIYGSDEISTTILTKEKEIQLELIKNANLRLEKERTYKRIFIVGAIVSLFFLIVIGSLFYKNQRVTKQLVQQNERIELQREDIRLINEQLMNRNSQLVMLNEEKNNLVRILAHDLRSPISQIMMVGELLSLSRPTLSEEEQRLVVTIQEGATRMNQMISKILDVDALESNKGMMRKEQVKLCQLVQEISARYRPIAASKQIHLVNGDCDEGYLIQTDHLLLMQVLENLVSNAVKFSPAGATVEVMVEWSPEQVKFRVKDAGPGFTEEDKGRMYTRFQRLSAKPTGEESSTGLGLSIVRKYVTELGGDLLLETKVGAGSTFTVVLPVT